MYCSSWYQYSLTNNTFRLGLASNLKYYWYIHMTTNVIATHTTPISPTCMTLPYCTVFPICFLYSVSFCFFSSSAALCNQWILIYFYHHTCTSNCHYIRIFFAKSSCGSFYINVCIIKVIHPYTHNWSWRSDWFNCN